jgi:hypothetical protein
MSPFCYRVEPFQIQQYRASEEALESRFTNFWAGVTYGARLLTRTRRFSFTPLRAELRKKLGPLDDIRDLIPRIEHTIASPEQAADLIQLVQRRQGTLMRATATLRDAELVQTALAQIAEGHLTVDALVLLLDGCMRAVWPWRWVKNYARAYSAFEASAPPLAIDHYFLCWPEDYANPEAIREVLKGTFLLPSVTQKPLPALFQGEYREESDLLAPVDAGQPYLTVLTAYDVRGEWDLHSLMPLLMGDHELVLAVDVQTLPRAKALRKATDAHNVLREAIYGKHAVKDARAERAYTAANLTLSRLDVENLHEVSYALLLQAPTIPALERQVQTIRDLLGARLRFDRVVGAQAEYLKLFTPLPSREIGVPLVRRNTRSHGVAVKTPWGIRKTGRLKGTLVGYDPHEGMPIHFDIWGESGYENAHMVMVGRAGSGKTVSLGTLALRQAVQGDQIIFFDPIGKCEWLCEAVSGGATYYDVATDAAINVLDPLSTDMGRQRDHVARKLAIILGRTATEGADVRFLARMLSNYELGALDRALQDARIYGPNGQRLGALRPHTAPVLEDLVAALRTTAQEQDLPEAAALAREIELLLLGSRANIFNTHTTLAWDFASDVVGYNFSGADPAMLPLYYDHGFEALNLWVKSRERARRSQKLVAIIDEYRYMASVRELESYVAFATKTWRNFGAAFWTADQNAITYFGQEGNPSQWGAFTANNCLLKVFFRQEGSEADILARAYRDQLAPEHVERIKTSGAGECIAMLGDEVHHLLVQLTDQETPFFIRKTSARAA